MPPATKRSTSGGRHRKDPDPLAEQIGQRIKELRLERGIKFDEFVGATEMGRGYVSELERGLVVPSVRTLQRVAHVIGVTLADLVAVGDSPRERLLEATLGMSDREVRKLLAAAKRR